MDYRPSSNRWVSKRTLSQQSKQRDSTPQCSANALPGAEATTNGACLGRGGASDASSQAHRSGVSDMGFGNGTNGGGGACRGSPGHDTTPHTVHTVLPADRFAVMAGHALPGKSYNASGNANSSSQSNSSVSTNQVNHTSQSMPTSHSNGKPGMVTSHASSNGGIAVGALRRNHAMSHPDGEVTPPAPRSAQMSAAAAAAGHHRDYVIPSPRHHHTQLMPPSPPQDGLNVASVGVASGNGYAFSGKPHHTVMDVARGVGRGQGAATETTDGAAGRHPAMRHADPSPSVHFAGTSHESNGGSSGHTEAGPARPPAAAPLTTVELLAMLKTGRDAATPREAGQPTSQPAVLVSCPAAPGVSPPAPATAATTLLAQGAALGLANGTFGGSAGISVVANGMIVNGVSLQQLIAAGALPSTSSLAPNTNFAVNGGAASAAAPPPPQAAILTAQPPQASQLPPPQYGSLPGSNGNAAATASGMPTVVLGPMSVFNSVPDITAALSAGLLGRHEVQFVQADHATLMDGGNAVGCPSMPPTGPPPATPLSVAMVTNRAGPSAAALAVPSTAFTYDSLNTLLSNMLSPSPNAAPRDEAAADLTTCESQDTADSPTNLMQCVLPILEDDDEDMDGQGANSSNNIVISDSAGCRARGDARELQALLHTTAAFAGHDGDEVRRMVTGERPAPLGSAKLALDVPSLGLPPLPVDGQDETTAQVRPGAAKPGFSATLLSQLTGEARQGGREGARPNRGVAGYKVERGVRGRGGSQEVYFAPGPHTVTRMVAPAPIATQTADPPPALAVRDRTRTVTDLRSLLSELTEPARGVAAADGAATSAAAVAGEVRSAVPQATSAAPVVAPHRSLPIVDKPRDAQAGSGGDDGDATHAAPTPQQPAPAPHLPTMAELLAGGARGGVTQVGGAPLFANAWRQTGQEKGVAWPIETASPLLRKLTTRVTPTSPGVVDSQSVLLATAAPGAGKAGSGDATVAAAAASLGSTARMSPVVSAMMANARKEPQPRCVVTASESAAASSAAMAKAKADGSPGGAAVAATTRGGRTGNGPALDAPTVTRQALVAVFRDTPQSLRRRERARKRHDEATALCKSAAWPPHSESQVEKLLKQRNANKLLRHLTIVSFSRQHVRGVQELFDGWARNGIPAPDMSFGAYYYYVQEKSEKLLCMKHNGRGSALVHGYGKCDFESRRPNSVCRYEHVCLFCRSKEHGWFEESKCDGYQQLLNEMEELGVTEEDVEIMLDAMERPDKAPAWAR